jgi:hypothetical protein
LFRYSCADQQLELDIADRRLKLGLNVANTEYQYEVKRYSCHCNSGCLHWGGRGYC